MRVIRYNLELIQPVLIPDPQGEANSAISLSYIPGALLRGALIGRYRQTFDAAEPDIRALFLGDTTRYLNAYPVKDGQRALPISAAWRYDKKVKSEGDEARRTIYNFAHTTQGGDFQEESVDAKFIWLKEKGSSGERFSPPRQVNVHTQRNPRKGRAMPRDRKTSRLPEDAGTVYRYDAMAAGLTLQAMIFTEANDEQVEKLIALLKDATFWIGRARRAGYGEVRITVVEDDGQRENGSYNRPEATEHLPLMLTSDALLRDEWGQATLDPCAAVAAALGLPPSDFKVLDSAFLTAKVVGGFNRKWGLPLPQTLALAAGSTFDLETNAPLSTEQLEQLEQQGIGERRNEGFGQVLVRADEKEKINSERAQFQFTPAKLNLSEIESKLAQTLAERLLRRKLDDELRQLINRIELENTPLKHQIARLRVLLRELERGRQPHKKIEDEQLERLANYLQDVEGRRAGAQLAHAQIDEKPQAGAALKATLSVWIKAQLLPGSEELADDKYQTVVEAAQKRWSGLEVSLGAGVTATVDAATSQEYSLRLINQVLQRAAKLARAKEKERQDG